MDGARGSPGQGVVLSDFISSPVQLGEQKSSASGDQLIS